MGGRGEAGKFGEPLGDSGRRLNSFPKNFFGPGVFLGVDGVAGVCGTAGVVGAAECGMSSDVSESAEDVGVCGPCE